MTELLTYDQAVAERDNPGLQFRYPNGLNEWTDKTFSSFPFWLDCDMEIRHADTKSIAEFRLKPEPREWWESRKSPYTGFDNGDLRIGIFGSLEVARDEMRSHSKDSKLFHVREVLDDE